MFNKKKNNGDFDSIIIAEGKITSKIHASVNLNNTIYNFRLSSQIKEDEKINFTVLCFDDKLIDGLKYGDKINVEGCFINEIYKGKLRLTIYCNNINKK